MLRRALGEAMRRLTAASSDAGALVDRRIVVKLLVTFFERGRSPEVLALMARMLGMSGAARRAGRPGPGALVSGGCQPQLRPCTRQAWARM